MDLSILHSYVKPANEIERVVTRQTTQINVLRKYERHQDRQRAFYFRRRDIGARGAFRFALYRRMLFVPGSDARKNCDGDHGHRGEPRDTLLSARKHDKR